MVLFGLLIAFSVHSQPRYSHAGSLIIIGGGEIPESIYDVFAGKIGGKDKPVVYIPTATSDEEWIRAGKHLEKFGSRGFTNLHTLHTREREKTDDPRLLKMLQQARGVFLGGGDQELLAKAYGGTAVHRELVKLLDRGGVIMGTSAGATIMGSVLIGGDHRKTPHLPAVFNEGFSFMKQTAIDQHVLVRNRQFDLVPVLERYPNVLGMALDESTAAVVEGDGIKVVGKSYMLVYDQRDWEQQRKEWGRVFRWFRMYRPGEVLKGW
jgi:cyanophycinase